MSRLIEGALSAEALKQYWAVRSGLGWRDLSENSKLEVHGPDRIEFLHAVLSNDVQSLPDFSGRRGALLTATGKIVADFDYYRFPDFLLIDVGAWAAERLRTQLEGYIIMDDVTLRDRSEDFAHFAFEGPRSPEFLLGLLGGPLPESIHRIVVVIWRGARIWLVRRNALSDWGFEVMVPAECQGEFRSAIREVGAPFGLCDVGEQALEVLRLERGIPRYGVDYSEKNNPIEIQLTDSYSLTKGCYPGQEVVARATHIGGVARLLVKIRILGRGLPAAGARVFSGEGKEIGRITSAVHSPLVEGSIGFAMLRRKAAELGSRNEIEIGEGGRTQGEVVASFL